MLAIPTDIERPARLLAHKTGKSPEDVIRLAVEANARNAGSTDDEIDDAEREAMIDAARAIAARSAKRPLLDTRSEDDIHDYEHGIPGCLRSTRPP
jgi:antitoxin VapB